MVGVVGEGNKVVTGLGILMLLRSNIEQIRFLGTTGWSSFPR